VGTCPAIRRLIKRTKDRFANAFEIIHHIRICDVDHQKAEPLELTVTLPIGRCIMRIAIHFHDQRLLSAQEVGNEGANHGLSPELVPTQLRTGQLAPQALFRLGRCTAHVASLRAQPIKPLNRQPPPPTPPLKGRGGLPVCLVGRS